jgi:putative endonuclease
MNVRSWLANWRRAKPLGERGEDAATRYLKRKRYRIVARRVDSKLGELDIIAVDGRTIVFVEVKTRTSGAAGHPSEAIDERKQQRMTRAALAWLKSKGLLNNAARFDVVAVTWPDGARRPTIEHYQNAFEPVGFGQMYG